MYSIRVTLIHSWDGADRNNYFVSPPLGVHRIAKWARAKLGDAVDIEVIDPNLFEPTDTLDTIATRLWLRQPDVIGFSPLHLTLENDLGIMLTAKSACPNALFIAGGRQATTDPHTLFSNFEALHTIVKGEAELIFVKILEVLLKHGTSQVNNNPAYLADIDGLFIKGHKQTIRNTGPNPGLSASDFKQATWHMDFTEMNLSDYWDLLLGQYSKQQLTDPSQLRKIFTIKPITTNFCPMNCSFCDVTSKQRRDIGSDLGVVGLRGKELEQYLNLLLEKHPKVQQILFKDDLWFLRGKGAIRGLTTSPRLFNDLEALKRVKNNFPNRQISFSGKARVDTFVDPRTLEVDWKLLNATREAGFVSVSMGIESFDNDDLVYFNKRLGKHGPEVNKQAIRSITKAGISSVSYLILTNDNSTIERVMRSADSVVDLIEESPKHVIKINDFLYPLPGTDLSNSFDKRVSDGRSLIETKQFSVPGFSEKYIQRIVKIYPEDPATYDLMMEYEEKKSLTEQTTKCELGIKHWISEYSTPAYMRLLYRISKRRGFISAEKADRQISRLSKHLRNLSQLRVENYSATLTDA